jgi:excisionase family DNA binding protein
MRAQHNASHNMNEVWGISTEMFLTPEQVSARLQMSRLTILHWLRTGKLPSVRLGKLYRIRQEDLEATLQAHQYPRKPL